MSTIYYSPFTYKSIARNDNWKYGGNATTFISDEPDFSGTKIEVNQFGKTKEEAKTKLLKVVSSNNANEIVESPLPTTDM